MAIGVICATYLENFRVRQVNLCHFKKRGLSRDNCFYDSTTGAQAYIICQILYCAKEYTEKHAKKRRSFDNRLRLRHELLYVLEMGMTVFRSSIN